ncbi:TPM domain-containing protein [Granulosicoccus sp. 3-233]|uniref:TPM domain-containing protein n=1 Tax=Granulosicoccus sp. 3-233 TaxID=3417969 RepID=UPI003D3443F1
MAAISITSTTSTNFASPVRLLLALYLLCLAGLVQAQADFPVLTGRVVDQAELLNASEETSLTAQLEAHEQETGNQLVIATITSLDGRDIADYANRLGRFWQIGTSENDNGVLLLVAPNERKVRIEVGYGLEGALTDSLSSIIIQREILPAFRQGSFSTGIQQGVDAILQAIRGEYTAAESGGKQRRSDSVSRQIGNFIPLIFIAMVGVPHLLRKTGHRKAANGAFPAGFAGLAVTLGSGNLLIGLAAAVVAFLFVYFMGSGKGGGGTGRTRRTGHIGGGGFRGGGSLGGGGFSGGGGSFGGGGASGGW